MPLAKFSLRIKPVMDARIAALDFGGGEYLQRSALTVSLDHQPHQPFIILVDVVQPRHRMSGAGRREEAAEREKGSPCADHSSQTAVP